MNSCLQTKRKDEQTGGLKDFGRDVVGSANERLGDATSIGFHTFALLVIQHAVGHGCELLIVLLVAVPVRKLRDGNDALRTVVAGIVPPPKARAQTKIGELDVTASGEHYVVRLDVSVATRKNQLCTFR